MLHSTIVRLLRVDVPRQQKLLADNNDDDRETEQLNKEQLSDQVDDKRLDGKQDNGVVNRIVDDTNGIVIPKSMSNEVHDNEIEGNIQLHYNTCGMIHDIKDNQLNEEQRERRRRPESNQVDVNEKMERHGDQQANDTHAQLVFDERDCKRVYAPSRADQGRDRPHT